MPNVGASAASFGARGVEHEKISYVVSEQIMDNPSLRHVLTTCTPSNPTDRACATQLVEKAGLQLWRRPLTPDEVEKVVDIGIHAAATLEDFWDGMEYSLSALLQSPYHLYRAEIGEDNPSNGTNTYSDYDMASKLSFFLWNSAPDTELMQAASEGRLGNREDIYHQANRLMNDPKFNRGIRQLFTEMLRLYELEEMTKDPSRFEHFTAELGQSAKEETLRFYERIVMEGIDYKQSMTRKETEINQQLAAIYDMPAPSFTGGFGAAKWPINGQRGGWLGQVSFLAQNAHAVSTSATLRGKAVRSILLCQDVPPAPVDVDTSIPEPSGTTLTLRDRVAEHLENPSCAGCHTLMDPIGLGFENFDGIGRWRETDNGAPIDPSGELEGSQFNNPIEMGEIIANSPAFTRCMVSSMARYANGRMETTQEREIISVLDERFAHHDRDLKLLIMEFVLSPLFLNAGTVQ